MTTLYLDVTHTYVSGLATGIQRVVRNVAAELLDQDVAGIDRVCLVVAMDGHFLLLNALGVDHLLHPSAAPRHPPSRGLATRLVAKVGVRFPRVMEELQHHRFTRAARKVIDRRLTRADVSAGDLVLLIDAFWGGSATLAAGQHCRARGATIVGVVHDLIPITHPGYMTPISAKLFDRSLRKSLSICHGFVAVSQSTARELTRFAEPRPIPLEVVYSGTDFFPLPMTSEPATGSFTYIAVGTLEPRKGHDVILDAFESLWAEGSDARLVFVGRRGWGVDPLWRRCHDLMKNGAAFQLVEDADDATLGRFLALSSAAIVASAVEGFGMPVVEALNSDLPVIASDIPVFREIAGDAVALFTVGNPGALAAAIRAFERDPRPMQAAARRFAWSTWHQAAPEFAKAALRIRDQAEQPPPSSDMGLDQRRWP